MSEYALFAVAPYLAAASLLAGTLGGLLDGSSRERPRLPASGASAIGGRHRVLTIGLVCTSIAHVAIVVWPGQLAAWSQPLDRLLVLEAGLFVLGLSALAGILIVAGRYALRPSYERIGVIDMACVGLVLVAIVSGLAIALRYRFAVAWSAVTLAPYVRSVAQLEPDLRYLESLPYLVKLHLFSSVVLIAFVPFTTPMRVWLRAARRTIDRLLLPVSSALDRRWTLFRDSVRRARHAIQFQEDDQG
jgi:nitrate reductase gamma subunit